MKITLEIEIPDNIAQEALVVLAEEKGLQLEGKTLTEQRNLVAQALTDERIVGVMESIKRKRLHEAEKSINEDLGE